MVGIFKAIGSIFSGNGDKASTPKVSAQQDYQGYTITSTPQPEGGQFRLCGLITKEIDGETKEHKFIRADLFQSTSDADEVTIRKAKMMIDQQGDLIFKSH